MDCREVSCMTCDEDARIGFKNINRLDKIEKKITFIIPDEKNIYNILK